jgi:hypothetical protein
MRALLSFSALKGSVYEPVPIYLVYEKAVGYADNLDLQDRLQDSAYSW